MQVNTWVVSVASKINFISRRENNTSESSCRIKVQTTCSESYATRLTMQFWFVHCVISHQVSVSLESLWVITGFWSWGQILLDGALCYLFMHLNGSSVGREHKIHTDNHFRHPANGRSGSFFGFEMVGVWAPKLVSEHAAAHIMILVSSFIYRAAKVAERAQKKLRAASRCGSIFYSGQCMIESQKYTPAA